MKSFELLQYNAHKSWSVMATFLRDDAVLEADIIAVQEPWRNEQQHTTHQPATAKFQLLYPAKQDHLHDSDTNFAQPGVCLFVSKNVDPGTWSCQLVSQDYQLLKLRRANRGRDWTDLFVHNVYNRPGGGTLAQLRDEFGKASSGGAYRCGRHECSPPSLGRARNQDRR